MILMTVKPLLSSSKKTPTQIYKLRYCHHFKNLCFSGLEWQSQVRSLHLAVLAPAVKGGTTAVCLSSLMTRKSGYIYKSHLTHLGNVLNQITLMILKKGRQWHCSLCPQRWTMLRVLPSRASTDPLQKTWRNILLHTSSDLFDHDPEKNLELANFHHTKGIAATEWKREMFWVGS